MFVGYFLNLSLRLKDHAQLCARTWALNGGFRTKQKYLLSVHAFRQRMLRWDDVSKMWGIEHLEEVKSPDKSISKLKTWISVLRGNH